jgi:tetratricopeptide (TPR) repeat protein
LANILLTSRQFPEALPHFLKYLELRPDDPDGLTGLARCQRALQQPEQALATLDRIATDRPQPAEAFLVRGLLLLDEDKPQEALPWLQKAHGRWPGALDTNHAMSRVLRELGRDADAIPYDERRLQIERAAKRMENLMKDLLTTVQRDSTGRPIRDDAAIAKSVALRYEAGTLMLEIGDENEAAAWFLSAVQEDPNHADSRRALADFHRRQNERKGGPTVAPTGARSPFGSGAPSGEPKP